MPPDPCQWPLEVGIDAPLDDLRDRLRVVTTARDQTRPGEGAG
jgi:hypothetical protein